MTTAPPPIACELTDAALAARRLELKTGLFAEIDDVRELSNGYAMSFSWSKERLGELAELVAFESQCCPFLQFDLSVEPNRARIELSLTGPAGTKAFLRDELRESGALTEPPSRNPPAPRGSWLVRGGAALTAISGAALVCCVLPALGFVGVGLGAGALGAYLDAGAVVGLVLGGSLVGAGMLAKRTSCTAAGGCTPTR